ncbi:MAG: hypothetical protein KGL43_19205 [Burkholderiales bacterium]|nr:hypothetical protein [Burkholderiales bacterium]MDE2398822.1 hypothetical protein [Burkholderiales bacterium]MDE2455722.1 hypothetical protein [Burkholderiales bacterium]
MLRTWALDRSGARSLDRLREAAGLARTFGLERVFVDAHPALGDWVHQVLTERSAPGEGPVPLAVPIRPRHRACHKDQSPLAPEARNPPSTGIEMPVT